MKRILFFFGVLATVAVGHAVANNATSKLLVEPVAGILNSTTTGTSPTCNIQDVPCNRTEGEPCTLGPGNAQLYAPTAAGLCNIQLFRDLN